jgi:AraC-like DNA-binding protein
MDFHKFPSISVNEAKAAHFADEQIQHKYGVKYLQFWVNEQAGNIFCLVEGPDIQTVELVHARAHGHIACAIVEVDPNYYSVVMGTNMKLDGGLVHRMSGVVDPGTRFILCVSFHQKPIADDNVSRNAIDILVDKVSRHNGRRIKLSGDDVFVSVFDSPRETIQCAEEIQAEFLKKSENESINFAIGLSAGQPVTENNEFIEETIRLAKRLCLVAEDSHIFVSTLFNELCDDAISAKRNNFRTLSANEETFLGECFTVLDAEMHKENFDIDSLVKSVGTSRAQLYRKIQSLTGKAPNAFIRALRLEKARSLLKRKKGNISEVAYEVGFSNPSYFAKCFAERYGYLPSQVS